MKTAIFIAAALAANVNGAAIEKRQFGISPRPTTSRGVPGGTPDGISAPVYIRDPQDRPPQFSIGNPTQSITIIPNDPFDRVGKCGLDAFLGHTEEALIFCSSILKGGTATQTTTVTQRDTTTTRTTVVTTLYPPSVPASTSRAPSSTPRPTSSARPPTSTVAPPSSTVRPPSSTARPPSSSARVPSSTVRPPTSTARPSSSTVKPPSSTPRPSSSSVITPSSTARPASSTIRTLTSTTKPPVTSVVTPSPTTTATPAPPANCGIVGYTKATAAYLFDSSGTKNNWAGCAGLCKADSKCKSFGYGEANCMLFDVPSGDNTNYNPMSPYTFYDKNCPEELPVKMKRQLNISLGLGPPAISSACSCLVTDFPAATTITKIATVTSNRVTATQTVTRTVSLLPDSPAP